MIYCLKTATSLAPVLYVRGLGRRAHMLLGPIQLSKCAKRLTLFVFRFGFCYIFVTDTWEMALRMRASDLGESEEDQQSEAHLNLESSFVTINPPPVSTWVLAAVRRKVILLMSMTMIMMMSREGAQQQEAIVDRRLVVVEGRIRLSFERGCS